jgi:hypothetical protein
MKVYKFIILFILINQLLFAQEKTEAYFGLPGRMDYANDVTEIYDKGYYISGGYEYETGWNIKTDKNLEFLHSKTFEHSFGEIGIRRSISDDNGNIYMCGYLFSPVQWPIIMKLDSCGNNLWCKVLQYDDEFEDGSAKDIIITKDNEIALLTSYDSEEEIDKLHIVGLNSNGDVLWIKPYASKNDYPWIREQNAYSMSEINNDYYISGYCYYPYPDDTTHFFLRPLFIGIDSLFNEKWILPFYALDSVFGVAYKTIPLNDSVFMGVGTRSAYNSNDEYQGLLMFYNIDGEELGYHGIPNDQLGSDVNGSDIRDVARINDTLFMTASFFGPEYGGNPGGEFVVSTSGNVYNYNSRPNTKFPKLIKTVDNNYVFVTNISEDKSDWDIYIYKIDENLNDVPFDPTPHNYDSLCPGGIQSGTIDMTDCFVWTNIGNAPSPKEYYARIKLIPIRAYPNPVTECPIIFEFENTEHHKNIELKCFDNFGKAIHNQKIYRYQETAKVKINNWRKGIYIGVVYSNGLPVGQCKFVVQ